MFKSVSHHEIQAFYQMFEDLKRFVRSLSASRLYFLSNYSAPCATMMPHTTSALYNTSPRRSSRKAKMLKNSLTYHNTFFEKSAAKLNQCPKTSRGEVAFAGRSNAGKSSALNKLTQQKKLARTSKTPGRTQLLNYFKIGDAPFYLVDLPGYGFAKVALDVKAQWQQELMAYLQKRESLRGLVILMDIRHPLKEYDLAMLDWTHQVNMPVHVLLTKADKLKRGAAQNTLLKVRKQIKDSFSHASVQVFSSYSGEGVDELARRLDAWLLASDADSDSEIGTQS